MAALVKFTRTREELNPDKKMKFGGHSPEKLKKQTFDIFVNPDQVAYVDDGEFAQSTTAHEVATTIHLQSGTTIQVDQSVSDVLEELDDASQPPAFRRGAERTTPPNKKDE